MCRLRIEQQLLTLFAPGNTMGMNLKFLLPFWMNSFWSCAAGKEGRNKEGKEKQSRDEDQICTPAAADLFVYVDGVEGPLVVLQPTRGRRHRLVVLGADDDDDQILLLGVRHKARVAVFHVEKELQRL